MCTPSRWKARLAAACLASAVAASTVPSGFAQDAPKPAAAAAGAAPAVASSQPHDPSIPMLLPEVNVKDVPLPDLIDYLRDIDPAFQAVIAYDPGAKLGEPRIQELRLKNVSAESVLKLLAQTYPRIALQEVRSETGTGAKIWTVRIEADPNSLLGHGSGGGTQLPGGFAPEMEMPGGMGQVPGVVTVVHRLREIVDDIAPPNGGPAERKTALESVLSLVQAALETGGGGGGGGAKRQKSPGVELKLHEATETLIFHGPTEQSGIVAQALETLAPRRTGGDRDRGGAAPGVNTQLRQLSTEIERLRRQVGVLQQAAETKSDPGAKSEGGPAEPTAPGGAPGGLPGDPTAAPRPGAERK
jgi:hypothetical protein